MATSSERRNERARERGYASYYDYRIHDYGRIPPGQEVPYETRERLAGRRGLAGLLRTIEGRRPSAEERAAGVTGRVQPEEVLPVGLERDARGRWTVVDVVVLDAAGHESHFRLTGAQASQANLKRVRASLEAEGVSFHAAPSIDVFANVESSVDAELEHGRAIGELG